MQKERLVLAVGLMLVLLGACEEEPPFQRVTDATPIAPDPTTTDGKLTEGERLVEGENTSEIFTPQVTFELPPPKEGDEEFRVLRQTERLFMLDIGTGRQLVVARPDRVFTYTGPKPKLAKAPADLRGWITSIPHFRITKEGRGGPLKAPFLEVKAESAGPVPDTCPIDCVPIFWLEVDERSVFAVKGTEGRFYFPDGDLIVVLLAPDLGDLDPSVEDLLASLRF